MVKLNYVMHVLQRVYHYNYPHSYFPPYSTPKGHLSILKNRLCSLLVTLKFL